MSVLYELNLAFPMVRWIWNRRARVWEGDAGWFVAFWRGHYWRSDTGETLPGIRVAVRGGP